MHFEPILAIACAYFRVVHADSPPRDILVSYPSQGAQLHQNVSLSFTELGQYVGLLRNYSISVRYPNSTLKPLMFDHWGEDPRIGCGLWNSTSTANIRVDQEGLCVILTSIVLTSANPDFVPLDRYTVFWNLTYGMSSNTSLADGNYCGPPPYTFEHWSLNGTFEVRDGASNATSPTTATQIPTEPTGTVREFDPDNPNSSSPSDAYPNAALWSTSAMLAGFLASLTII